MTHIISNIITASSAMLAQFSRWRTRAFIILNSKQKKISWNH